MTASCFKCNQSLEYAKDTTVGRSDSCPKCSRSVRVCRNCMFFDPNKHNECSEPQSERVVDKEQANFCDYFKLNFDTVKLDGTSTNVGHKEKTLADLDDLFKK